MRGAAPRVPCRNYELGLDVSDAPPHVIRRAVQLVGADGRAVAAVQDGDELVAVNGQDVIKMDSLRTRPDLMMGTEGSVMRVTIKTRAHERTELIVRRLVSECVRAKDPPDNEKKVARR